ncbi:purine-nucleoside phosphorylase [Salsipaludibacter albus]|uniref:purine-nucleoside phosphorylase n=1 Tax=Salsipaludibacter albus TaxID=2849650 RepID=UPI001EE42220|nr:purine-nucleoside phosphorylase [Salsipaludibacter albus]
MTDSPDARAAATADSLGAALGGDVDVLVTLGSGLAGVADVLDDTVEVATSDLVGIPDSTVPGHTSMLRYGRIGDLRVLAQVGRIHLYEGHRGEDVTRMVDAAALLGASTFVVTNAAGGLEPSWTPGDVMLLHDHLNLTGTSPLVGVVRDGGPVFVDMATPYDPELRALAHAVAGEHDLSLREGVYAGLLGPSYETPAEVAMLRTLGATAVGMSTVLEVVAARARGMQVLGMSTITNVHGEGVETTHDEVIEVGAAVAADVTALVSGILARLAG